MSLKQVNNFVKKKTYKKQSFVKTRYVIKLKQRKNNQQLQGCNKFNNSYPLVKRSNLFVYFCLSLCTKTQSCLLLWISVSTNKRLCQFMVSNWGCFIIIIFIIPGEWRALSLRVEGWKWNSGPVSLSLAWLGRKERYHYNKGLWASTLN